jgi:ElaB/YqjD/DUF883 family membrane-anchored ribosome-binding protein
LEVKKMANKRSNERIGLRKRTHNKIDKIMDRAESISESGKEGIARLKEKAIRTKENVDSYIHKKPGRVILIGAGVGAVIGGVITASIIKRRE